MIVVGDDAYAVLATPGLGQGLADRGQPGRSSSARSTRSGRRSPSRRTGRSSPIRSTSSGPSGSTASCSAPARRLCGSVTHLIFEPDGAMLRLPPNLLVTERAGIDAYLAKARRAGRRRLRLHLGPLARPRPRRQHRRLRPRLPRRPPGRRARARPSPISASARTRRRKAPAIQQAAVRGLLGEAPRMRLAARPMGEADLRRRAAHGAHRRSGRAAPRSSPAQAFSDSAIKARGDLVAVSDPPFRHPRPGHRAAPRMPGPPGADDLVRRRRIRTGCSASARFTTCASTPTSSSSRPATPPARRASPPPARPGLRGGGDFALDGLVRAFVGAGGRSVVASHWPVPDDYDATNRLISGLFTAPPGTSTATALRQAQDRLMARPDDLASLLLGRLRDRRRRRRAGAAEGRAAEPSSGREPTARWDPSRTQSRLSRVSASSRLSPGWRKRPIYDVASRPHEPPLRLRNKCKLFQLNVFRRKGPGSNLGSGGRFEQGRDFVGSGRRRRLGAGHGHAGIRPDRRSDRRGPAADEPIVPDSQFEKELSVARPRARQAARADRGFRRAAARRRRPTAS